MLLLKGLNIGNFVEFPSIITVFHIKGVLIHCSLIGLSSIHVSSQVRIGCSLLISSSLVILIVSFVKFSQALSHYLLCISLEVFFFTSSWSLLQSGNLMSINSFGCLSIVVFNILLTLWAFRNGLISEPLFDTFDTIHVFAIEAAGLFFVFFYAARELIQQMIAYIANAVIKNVIVTHRILYWFFFLF